MPQAVVPLDPSNVETAIAGTFAAAATQTAQAAPSVTLSPTVAPTKTTSPTPFPTFTVVVVAPRVYVIKPTNCRLGPGKVYKSVGALKTGQTVQVVGRSRDGKYWIIRNPGNLKQLCWISGVYANVTGVAGILPIMTAPPTPKPTRTPKPPTRTPKPVATTAPPTVFTATYSSTVNCTGSEWYMQVDLANTSPTVPMESIYIGFQDLDATNGFIEFQSESFINNNGCSSDSVNTIPPGSSHLVSLPALTYDPTGHTIDAWFAVCAGPGLDIFSGCSIKEIHFTP
jgi:hypothetical protein